MTALCVVVTQLKKVRDKGLIFIDFEEAPIRFPPTFKFNMGTDTYDTRQVLVINTLTEYMPKHQYLICDTRSNFFFCNFITNANQMLHAVLSSASLHGATAYCGWFTRIRSKVYNWTSPTCSTSRSPSTSRVTTSRSSVSSLLRYS